MIAILPYSFMEFIKSYFDHFRSYINATIITIEFRIVQITITIILAIFIVAIIIDDDNDITCFAYNCLAIRLIN